MFIYNRFLIIHKFDLLIVCGGIFYHRSSHNNKQATFRFQKDKGVLKYVLKVLALKTLNAHVNISKIQK